MIDLYLTLFNLSFVAHMQEFMAIKHSVILNYSEQSACHFILRSMAKWLKDYLNFGTRRDPPQPPRPDYSESEILRAYRAQKELDFEDPYQHIDKEHQNGGFSSCSATVSLPSFPAFGSVLPNGVEVGHACFYGHVHEKRFVLM